MMVHIVLVEDSVVIVMDFDSFLFRVCRFIDLAKLRYSLLFMRLLCQIHIDVSGIELDFYFLYTRIYHKLCYCGSFSVRIPLVHIFS